MKNSLLLIFTFTLFISCKNKSNHTITTPLPAQEVQRVANQKVEQFNDLISNALTFPKSIIVKTPAGQHLATYQLSCGKTLYAAHHFALTPLQTPIYTKTWTGVKSLPHQKLEIHRMDDFATTHFKTLQQFIPVNLKNQISLPPFQAIDNILSYHDVAFHLADIELDNPFIDITNDFISTDEIKIPLLTFMGNFPDDLDYHMTLMNSQQCFTSFQLPKKAWPKKARNITEQDCCQNEKSSSLQTFILQGQYQHMVNFSGHTQLQSLTGTVFNYHGKLKKIHKTVKMRPHQSAIIDLTVYGPGLFSAPGCFKINNESLSQSTKKSGNITWRKRPADTSNKAASYRLTIKNVSSENQTVKVSFHCDVSKFRKDCYNKHNFRLHFTCDQKIQSQKVKIKSHYSWNN